MSEKPVCPVCASNLAVYKVSQVYVAGITLPAQRSEGDRAALQAVFGRDLGAGAESQQAARPFGPPQGSTRVLRPVHPDLVVAFFSLFAVIFLVNTFQVSLFSFWIILFLWLVGLIGYAFGRAGLDRRHQAALRAAYGEKDQVQKYVAAWMKLYYCAEDGCVFDPERGGSVPLADLQPYLRQSV